MMMMMVVVVVIMMMMVGTDSIISSWVDIHLMRMVWLNICWCCDRHTCNQ